jgi:flagellar hook assembly protein FlgD
MSHDVELSVYNLLRQKVATLVSGKQKAGYHQVKWDASQPAGIASGIYLYRLEAGDFVETKKMILMR